MGSRVIRIEADIDSIIARVNEIARSRDIFLSSTTRRSNPFQTEAAKTIAFEVVEALGRAPDYVIVPVGGGGTIAGIWRGFCELRERATINSCPRLIGVVPERYDALAAAYDKGVKTQAEFDALPYAATSPTLMPKLAHLHPPDGIEALGAVRDSSGHFFIARDEDAKEGQARLACRNGLYVELSSGGVVGAVDGIVKDAGPSRRLSIAMLLCGSGYREAFIDIERHAISERRASLGNLEESIVAASAAHLMAT